MCENWSASLKAVGQDLIMLIKQGTEVSKMCGEVAARLH